MKKLFLFICMILLVAGLGTGCQDGEKAAADPAVEQEITDEFVRLVDSGTNPLEVHDYLLEKMPELGAAKAEELVATYLAFLDRDETYWRQVEEVVAGGGSVEEFYNYMADDRNIEKVANPGLRQVLEDAIAAGYKWYVPEGMPTTLADYTAINRDFGSFLSGSYQEYLQLMATLTDPPESEDAGLMISWDELAQRIVLAEEFLQNNSDSPHAPSIADLHNFYLTDYFLGLNNTPAFSYEDNLLTSEVKESYVKTIKEHAGTQLAEKTAKYFAYLETQSFKEPQGVYDWLIENEIILPYQGE